MLYFWFVTFCGICWAFVPKLAKWISAKLFHESDREKNLKRELRELVKERSTVNPVDSFARYARINRKVDKVREALGEHNLENTKFIYKTRLISTAVLYGIVSIINFYLIWHYRNVPLVKVPTKWLDPFGKLVINEQTGLGLIPWLVVSASSGRLLVKYLSKEEEAAKSSS